MSATTTLRAILLGEDVSMGRTLKGAAGDADHAGRRFGNLRGELKNLGKGTGSFRGVAKGAFKDVGSSAAGLGGKMGLLGAGVAGVAALGTTALIPFAKSSIDSFKRVAGEVLGFKRVMGSTPEEASRVRFAMHEVGIGADTGQRAISLFSKKLDGAKGSTKATAKMIKDLGFDFRDSTGHIKPMNDLLPQIADRFKNMPDGPEKTALAMKLFGKSGTQMLPFLNKGAAGMAEMAKKSDEFGLTLSGKNLQALKDSRAAQREWDASVEGLKVRFGADLLPMLTKVVGWMRDKMIPMLVSAGKWWEKHQETIDKVAHGIGLVLGALLKTIALQWKALAAIGGALGKVFVWLWNSAIQPAVTKILGGLAGILRMWAAMLRGLSHVPGFGWAKTAADKMDRAAGRADALRNAIHKIPTSKTFTLHFNTKGQVRLPNGVNVDMGVWRARAGGGSILAGKQYLVGENGPEIFSSDTSGHITPARQTAATMRAGSGSGSAAAGSDRPILVQLLLDGRVIQEALLRRKRQTGMSLGLA